MADRGLWMADRGWRMADGGFKGVCSPFAIPKAKCDRLFLLLRWFLAVVQVIGEGANPPQAITLPMRKKIVRWN
ncbi:MAG: hypothetical protein AB1797_01545 [bacterium]